MQERFVDLIPILAFDEASGAFLTKDRHLAFFFIGSPMIGADLSRYTMLKSALGIGLPETSMVQFTLVSSRDIAGLINRFIEHRATAIHKLQKLDKALLWELINRRADFIKNSIFTPLLPSYGQLTNDRVLIVTLKMPFKGVAPEEKDIENAVDVGQRFLDAIRTAGLYLDPAKPQEIAAIYRMVLYPASNDFEVSFVDNLTLDEAIVTPGSDVKFNDERIEINGGHMRVLGVKTLPPSSSPSLGYLMQGDYLGVTNQMRCGYMITLSLFLGKQADKIQSMKTKSMIANYQAFGPLMRFLPRLAAKKAGMDIIVEAMEDGEPLFDGCLQVVLFGPDEENVSSTASTMQTYYTTLGFKMSPEKYIAWPALFNALPGNPSRKSISNMFRYSTLAASHAVALAPFVAEYKGNGHKGCAMLHVSRRGQIMAIDLYDSTTNYNAVIFAESGAGKSFLTQDIITSYLSKGAQVWVIDVGRSYYKLCKVLGGEFIEFSDFSGICINPFTGVENIDDDAPLLQTLVEKMAAPNQGLDDYRLARIEEGIKSVWGNRGKKATISALAEYFNRHPDPRVQDIGAQLFSYTHAGSQGFWFDGEANVDLNHDLVVLELEELKGRKTLQQVILMQMIAAVQRQMYLSKDDRPKLLIIDEAWDLLDDPMVGKFIEHAYRRFRKYGGSAIIVTQSIADLYESKAGQAIAANSAFKFILKQNSEAIDRARENRHLIAPELAYQLMQTVHTQPGKYSEFLFMTDTGIGVCRLIVDRFTQVLYSSAPHERKPIIDAIERGVAPLDAINQLIMEKEEM